MGILVNFSLGYDSLQGGWSGDVVYINFNVFGLGYSFGVWFGVVQNQVGQNWVGSLNYIIFWFDFDFVDFCKNCILFSFGVGSDVGGNIVLFDVNKEDIGCDYIICINGFSLGLGCNIIFNLMVSVNVVFNNCISYFEFKQEGEMSNLDDVVVIVLLFVISLIICLSGNLNYDNIDNVNFLGCGVWVYGVLGYNVGCVGDVLLSWIDGEIGVSGYYGFGGCIKCFFGLEIYRQVFVVCVNIGMIIGIFFDGIGYFIGGFNLFVLCELCGLEDG